MAMLKQMTSLHQYKSICRLCEEEWDVYLETQKKQIQSTVTGSLYSSIMGQLFQKILSTNQLPCYNFQNKSLMIVIDFLNKRVTWIYYYCVDSLLQLAFVLIFKTSIKILDFKKLKIIQILTATSPGSFN